MFPKIPENSETGYSKLPCNLLTSSLTGKIPKGKTFRLDCFVGLCHTGLYILNPKMPNTTASRPFKRWPSEAGWDNFDLSSNLWLRWEHRGGHGAYFTVTKSGDESRLDTDRTVSTVGILCVTGTSEKFPRIGNGHNITAFSKTKRASHSSIVNATPESDVRIHGSAPTAFSAWVVGAT